MFFEISDTPRPPGHVQDTSLFSTKHHGAPANTRPHNVPQQTYTTGFSLTERYLPRQPQPVGTAACGILFPEPK
jgi:hypothetical protein